MVKQTFILILLTLFGIFEQASASEKYELVPDTDLESENKVFRQLIHDIDPNIEVQSYFVMTDDGYRLKVFRLVKPGQPVGPPVLMQHGLFQNAEKFAWIGPKSLSI